MKKTILFSIFIFQICLAQKPKQRLVWEENFNGNSLNQKNWNFELGNGCPDICGWGNNEKQIYTNRNHLLKNGNLIIQAQKQNGEYTSTRITTKEKKEFLYGRIEARVKLPIAEGMWSAFWMLGANISRVGWPKCGEIDILEHIGREPQNIFTSVHTQESHGNTINTIKTNIPNIQKGFHIYEINWSKEKIEFFVDKKSVYSYSPESKNDNNWPFDKPFYIIINLAIGGNLGGSKIDDNALPQDFEIDYIRVYQ